MTALARIEAWRARRKYHPSQHRTIAPPSLLGRGGSLGDRVTRWILPWTLRQYPGFKSGISELLGYYWSWSAIRDWRTGRHNMPKMAAQRFRDYIAGRCEQGLALVAELDKYIAEFERKPAGWQLVKDRDGDGTTRDARNRVGKRKKSPPIQP